MLANPASTSGASCIVTSKHRGIDPMLLQCGPTSKTVGQQKNNIGSTSSSGCGTMAGRADHLTTCIVFAGQ